MMYVLDPMDKQKKILNWYQTSSIKDSNTEILRWHHKFFRKMNNTFAVVLYFYTCLDESLKDFVRSAK